jgi:hypothetical protein
MYVLHVGASKGFLMTTTVGAIKTIDIVFSKSDNSAPKKIFSRIWNYFAEKDDMVRFISSVSQPPLRERKELNVCRTLKGH